ncbi:MAG: carbohydrate-binding domain-containing protein [Firmicutes bacterium]|nr:carbohydrate-binding domain-containing protein [Bacillota bacterium]
MQNKPKTKRLAGLLLAALVLIAGCAAATGSSSAAAATDYDVSGATAFTFSDSGITVKEGDCDGYKIEGTALSITASGTYTVSGACSDGSITVKKGVTGVTLVLDGLDLTSADSAPICCNKSSEVNIVAAAGSVNDLTDTEKNNDENYPDNENAENAVIKTKDGSQVTLSGSGTINVYAYGKNGVKGGAATETEGEASLTVKDLTLNIFAYVNDGLKSDQELNILSGTVTVEAADDGVKSDLVLNIGAAGSAGPTVKVNKSYEGIEGATINIYSGDISVTAEEDGINAANSDLTGYSFSLNIYGGKLCVDARTGDGLDSNGSLNISDGVVVVYASSSGDNAPLDSETSFALTGGTVLAVGSGAMAELPTSASQPYLVFGSQGGMMGGQPGQMGGMNGEPPAKPDGDFQPGDMGGMNGELPAKPDGDFQPGDIGGMNGEPPAKPDGDFQPGQMGEMPGSALSLAAGSTIAVKDASGSTLYEATLPRAASYVFFTSADLTDGDSCTLSVDGETLATATATSEAGAGGPVGQPGGPTGLPFNDVTADQWFFPAVRWVYSQNYMLGTSDTAFSPQATTNRAMIATILYRLAGSPAVSSDSSFSDVAADAWYADAVSWAADNGIYLGYLDGSFRPEQAITREQIAAVIYRSLSLIGMDDQAEAADLSSFKDASAVSDWAREAMSWCVGAGLFRGDAAGRLNPTASATRAELAQILMNGLDSRPVPAL